MKRPTLVLLGVVILLFGLLFTFQGLGYVKGSSMTNSNFWAVAGPIIGLAGLVFVFLGFRESGRPSGSADGD